MEIPNSTTISIENNLNYPNLNFINEFSILCRIIDETLGNLSDYYDFDRNLMSPELIIKRVLESNSSQILQSITTADCFEKIIKTFFAHKFDRDNVAFLPNLAFNNKILVAEMENKYLLICADVIQIKKLLFTSHTVETISTEVNITVLGNREGDSNLGVDSAQQKKELEFLMNAFVSENNYQNFDFMHACVDIASTSNNQYESKLKPGQICALLINLFTKHPETFSLLVKILTIFQNIYHYPYIESATMNCKLLLKISKSRFPPKLKRGS